ncbi:hypothetical protein L5M28_01155 [Shewanella sp. SW32]|uniref:helix-turn-helix transcriptional regulator n=1 Tax=unclassified Shewanella TaxID=196818 RepID=UPI0021DA111F|nr:MULTISPECIES: hypothetical protein [unclassified Shewanella]MCU7961201.1 hypothetical protein [Shewanella sp. SW32]MCU7969283.1 hypothetical protein [Shewanella sp. SW29]
MSSQIKGYWNTKKLTERYNCSSRTIFRWMKRDKHPFPAPKIIASGSNNLWSINDVEQWEAEQAQLSQHAA